MAAVHQGAVSWDGVRTIGSGSTLHTTDTATHEQIAFFSIRTNHDVPCIVVAIIHWGTKFIVSW